MDSDALLMREELQRYARDLRESSAALLRRYARTYAVRVDATLVEAMCAALGDISIDEAFDALDRLERNAAADGTQSPDRISNYREHLTFRMVQSGVPGHLHEGLREYFAARQPVGNFLAAVLANDLKDACLRADHRSGRMLVGIVKFLVAFTPGTAWGSRSKVEAWLADTEPAPEILE